MTNINIHILLSDLTSYLAERGIQIVDTSFSLLTLEGLLLKARIVTEFDNDEDTQSVWTIEEVGEFRGMQMVELVHIEQAEGGQFDGGDLTYCCDMSVGSIGPIIFG